MLSINTGSASSSGGRTVLALVGTFLTGGSVHEESASTSAGQSGVVEDGSSDAGGALG